VKRLVFIAAGLALGIAATVAAPQPQSLDVGGTVRHYLVSVPSGYDGSRAVPLVFVFHGSGYGGAEMERGHPFTALGEKKGFISVFPDGLDKQWNGGRTYDPFSRNDKSDDVEFVSRMIDALGLRYRIDPKRIFATGSSNGAIFCYTLAARLPARIAAIGPVSGSLGEEISRQYHPVSPVSVVSFNGTADPLVPYRGVHRTDGHGVLSVPDTIAFWVGVDGCAPDPVVTRDPASPLDDGLTILRLRYPPQRNGAEVLAFVIGSGGHTWPGAHTDPTWAKTAGKTAMSIDANEIMWDFFVAHPRP
jgi:polyhydroxybutyrate depolymerase